MNVTKILKETRTIAVVGLSNKQDRPSFQVASYLQRAGYKIIPVNPALNERVLDEISYPDLLSVESEVDLVNIFRKPEQAFQIVDQAITISAKAIWMQLGIVNQTAAEKAISHGLDVVMDRCIMIDHKQSAEFPEAEVS